MIRTIAALLAFVVALPCLSAAPSDGKTSAAAEPAAELLTLVPPDPGICLIVRDVNGHIERLADSPFLGRLSSSPLGKMILDGAGKKYEELDKQLGAHFQTSLRELRQRVFGDGFVFAYWPGNDGAAERGLFLLRAPKPELLDDLFNKLNELEKNSGNVTMENRQYKGMGYWRRVEKRGQTSYLLVHSGLLAVSQDERTIQQVMDLRPKQRASSAIWGQVSELGARDALAIFWLNPRSLDRAMQEKAKAAPPAEAGLQQAVLDHWRQITAVVLTLRVDADLEVNLHLRGQWPSAAKTSDGANPGSLEDLLSRFPERAIFAVAGQVDFTGLAAFVEAAVPASEKQKVQSSIATASQAFLGRDLLKEVLPNLGPNCGFCLAAPAADQKGWFPSFVFALQVRAPLDQALFSAVRAVAGMVVLAHTSEGLGTQLKPEQQDKVAVLSLVNPKVFPPGCQPAFASKSGYLLVAGSPETIRRFRSENGKSTGDGPGRRLVFLARFSFAEAVAYLRDPDRRAGMFAALAQGHQQPISEVEQQIDQLTAVMELCKEANLRVQRLPDQAIIKLQVTFAQPLRK